MRAAPPFSSVKNSDFYKSYREIYKDSAPCYPQLYISNLLFTAKITSMKKLLLTMVAGAAILLSAHTIKNEGHSIMEKAEVKNFTKPDEVREFPKGKVELIKIGNATIGKATFEPGWKWSESVQPIAKTKSCEAPHFQYHVSGVLKVKMDDGTILECKAGDVSLLPMGHDAWVVGNEPAVVIDFQGMIDYAKGKK
jgi:hypothetical protein